MVPGCLCVRCMSGVLGVVGWWGRPAGSGLLATGPPPFCIPRRASIG